MDFSTIITAVDWSTVGTGIVAIGAAIAGVVVVSKGVQFILSTLKRA
jgi:hypothetical protein